MSENGASGQRMTPLPAEEWGDAEYAAFGSLLGLPGDKVPRAGSGHRFDPMNFTVIGLLVRHPDLARAFLAFNSQLLQRNSMPVRCRELSILRVVHRRRCAYVWGEHVKIGLEAGITADEIDRLARGNDGFEGLDLLILEATDELLADGRLGDSAWARLNAELDTHQVMDLIFLVGTYAMIAMAFETWGLQPQPGMAPLPDAS